MGRWDVYFLIKAVVSHAGATIATVVHVEDEEGTRGHHLP